MKVMVNLGNNNNIIEARELTLIDENGNDISNIQFGTHSPIMMDYMHYVKLFKDDPSKKFFIEMDGDKKEFVMSEDTYTYWKKRFSLTQTSIEQEKIRIQCMEENVA